MTDHPAPRALLIFDTGTVPAYYGDIHKLLAAPAGFIISYEYRHKWIEPSVLKLVQEGKATGLPVLLAYAQLNSFTRGYEPSESDTDPENMLWVPTRLASLANVVDDGKKVHFDLKVGIHPASSQRFRDDMIDLAKDGRTPFNKFVIAYDKELPGQFGLGDAQDNWVQIVDALGTTPSQMVGDSFWRLLIPTSDGDPVEFTPHETSSDGRKHVRSELALIEGGNDISLPVVTHTPQGAAATPNRRLVTATSAGSSLEVTHGAFELRRYTRETVTIAIPLSNRIKERSESVTLETDPTSDEWATGPHLEIPVVVQKAKGRILLAAGLVVAGIVLLALGSADGAKAGLLIAGGLAEVGALMVFRGELKLKG